jgi:hypothetical protein
LQTFVAPLHCRFVSLLCRCRAPSVLCGAVQKKRNRFSNLLLSTISLPILSGYGEHGTEISSLRSSSLYSFSQSEVRSNVLSIRCLLSTFANFLSAIVWYISMGSSCDARF